MRFVLCGRAHAFILWVYRRSDAFAFGLFFGSRAYSFMGKQGFSRLAEAAFAAGALAADRAEPFPVLEVDTAVLAFHMMRPLSGIFIISNPAAQCKIFRRRAANAPLFSSAEGKRFRRYSGAPLEVKNALS